MKLRLPKKRGFRICIYIPSTLLILLAIDLIWVRIWRRITVSPQTTFITVPLKADGLPDYFRYIDDKSREGVTPDNNAVIPFFQAVSPSGPQNTQIATEYFQRLGIAPPDKPRTIVPFGDFLRSKNPPVEETRERADEEQLIRTHPWAAVDHPDAVAWLDSQSPLLAALPAITSRTRWYVPQVPADNGMLISVMLPYVSNLRPLASLALTRAMRELHDGQFAQAQSDILACHRLARLTAQGWTVIEYLVGLSIDNMALDADITFATAPGLSPDQRRQFAENLQSLPPWPKTLPSSFETERLAALDTMIWVAQHPMEIEEPMTLLNEPANVEALNAVSMALRPAHFNAAMADANEFYNEMEKSIQAPTIAQREQLMARFDADVQAYSVAHGGPLGDSARQIITVMVPYLSKANKSHDAHEVTISLTHIALALITLHEESGSYPATLAALTPKYLTEIPPDAYSDQLLQYRKTPDGFLLYSVGPNHTDDGGRRVEASNTSDAQSPDDIVVRVPAAEK